MMQPGSGFLRNWRRGSNGDVGGKGCWYNFGLMIKPLSDCLLPLRSRWRRVALDLLAARSGLLVCGLFLTVGWAVSGDYGLGQNEPAQRLIALANLNYILGNDDHIAVWQPHDMVYGVSVEAPLLLTERYLGLDDYYYAHLLRVIITHLIFILGGYCCYRLAYQLFGSRLIALFALLLFLLHPRLYGHSFLNAKDLPFLSMFVIALYLLERAFRKDTVGAFMLSGLAVGVATNLRIMGIILLAAVMGMRVLDLAMAQDGKGRRQVLLTGWLFALTAVGVVYGLSPYAWSDPIDYLTVSLNLTVNHPHIQPQLFQGEWLLSNKAPWHYSLTWFAITTPPPALLLGVIGMAAVAAGGAARPGAIFGNTRLRFGGLLLACFILPLAAVVLLDSNRHDGWRHIYFIYGPFCLLAVGGGWTLAAALARRGRWRAGGYGLLGLSLALTLLQMAQIHPYQQVYFNFLVDRTTPEYLSSQYGMHTEDALWEGLRYVLERHPGERMAVVAASNAWLPLPAADRQRLWGGQQDLAYALAYKTEQLSGPDWFFDSIYTRSLYSNVVLRVNALDQATMDGTAAADYAGIYRAAVAGEPVSRADYDVYLNGRQLVFVKENCAPGDLTVPFVARVYAGGAERTPGRIPETSSYTDFENTGARLGDKCLAALRLPDYPIDHLLAGQATGRGAWMTAYSFVRPSLGELAAELRESRPGPTAGKSFELFRQEGMLIYYREPCYWADTRRRFFLHLTPAEAAVLPPGRERYGFESREFRFRNDEVFFDGQCLATAPLPDYSLASIKTGQEGDWEFRGYPPVAPGLLGEYAAALAGAAIDSRGEFDLYWRDNTLIYWRKVCAVEDTAAGFFLHIRPADDADLAAGWREYGFESRDFDFDRWGGRFGGQCLAMAPLPDYPIAAIRTGQYAAGQGELWSVELTREG